MNLVLVSRGYENSHILNEFKHLCVSSSLDEILYNKIKEFEEWNKIKTVNIIEELWDRENISSILLVCKKKDWKKKTETFWLCDIEKMNIE